MSCVLKKYIGFTLFSLLFQTQINAAPNVMIGPDLGFEPAYNGSSLLTNLPQENGDLVVLQYRKSLENATPKGEIPEEYYLVLSGTVFGQISSLRTYVNSQLSDVDLMRSNLTAMGAASKWATVFLSLEYDNLAPPSLTPPTIGPRYYNSRVYLSQGFLSIGNLNTSDFYLSLGQMYLPFGSYNGYMINSPITSTLFTTVERPILLGYSHAVSDAEVDVSAYGYQGETITFAGSSAINEWGADFDFMMNKPKWNSDIGIGYISNIADAEGFQLNGQPSQDCTFFGGLAFSCSNGELLKRKIPGFDIHGVFTYSSYSVVAEYITSLRHFHETEIAYNRKGAKPRAFDVEFGYSFRFLTKPSTVAVGYSYTKEALALLVPAHEVAATVTTSLWRNTTESIEFQHDVNYSKYTDAGGQSLSIFPTRNRQNLGGHSNAVIFAINVSF